MLRCTNATGARLDLLNLHLTPPAIRSGSCVGVGAVAVPHLGDDAAAELKKEIRRPVPAEAGSWRFRWMSGLFRAVRRRDWHALQETLERLPEDADLVIRIGDGFRIRDEGMLADRLHAAATHAMLVERRRDVRAAPSEEAKRAARARWASRLSAGSPKSRVLSSYAVADADGHTIWNIRAGGISAEFAGRFGRAALLCEPCAALIRCPSSRCRLWTSLPTAGAQLVRRQAPTRFLLFAGPMAATAAFAYCTSYSSVVRGDPVPANFSQAGLVLIPKTPIAPDVAHVALPANLRLRTLRNSSQNIVAKALCAPLEAVAQSAAHEAQRGFVRGRHGVAPARPLRSSCMIHVRIQAWFIWIFRLLSPVLIGLGWSGFCIRWTYRLGSSTPFSPPTTERMLKLCFMGGLGPSCASRKASSKVARHLDASGHRPTIRLFGGCFRCGRGLLSEGLFSPMMLVWCFGLPEGA